jgi:hypothetical protein
MDRMWQKAEKVLLQKAKKTEEKRGKIQWTTSIEAGYQ